MVRLSLDEIIYALMNGDFLWLIIPIFFVGVITDKYQEEFGTSIGNAISNGALIIFTGFSWFQIIFSRENFPIEATISQFLLSLFIIIYGFSIIASGFKTGEFAQKYGRIRVVTFMLVFFTMMIYVPLLYNFVSIVIFVLVFPFYYAFITELVKVMPTAGSGIDKKRDYIDLSDLNLKDKFVVVGKRKLKEYLN
jgi:hypothetical protein